jgi:adenylate cyclase
VSPRRRKAKRGDALTEIDRLRETVRETDATPELVAAAKFIRRLLPGEKKDEPAGGPSAIRELGAGVTEAWQAMSEAQKRKAGEVDVAILFTDLVGFSSWALQAGDEPALDLLQKVSAAEQGAISGNGGALVKRLGDGAMAVFSDADAAVLAALQAQDDLAEIEVAGHNPQLRAGVHLGRPRRVKRDFLGVDVNIAARVGELAEGGEVLVSDATCAALDSEAFRFGKPQKLSAPGAPEDITVCSVRAKG